MKTHNSLKLIGALILTCALTGALLAWVDNLTKGPIAQQEKRAEGG
ncbi:MAG: hypothetical protein J7J76_05155 [Candidatus Latescibacteria bacterium]|nr:hypothetical protein [Candidatus Latescibacterota bacterium]